MESQQKKVRKAVIAAAGFGTRFLPQTKAIPKEMLPLVDKPIIQFIVEELVDAGIEDIILVTGYHKRAIEDHFDVVNSSLQENLEKGNKEDILENLRAVENLANFTYLRQKGPYGNGTPILEAERWIGDEPFIYTFADDFVVASPSRFRQLIDLYQSSGASVLTCVRAKQEEDYERYGFVAGDPEEGGVIRVETIVEKPGFESALSDMASVSGYLFTPQIFEFLHRAKEDWREGSEFYLQDGLQLMIDEGHKVLGLEIKDGTYYDTGNKLEYVKTLITFALAHPEIGDQVKAYLSELNLDK